jgi:anti-anti-sigma factor
MAPLTVLNAGRRLLVRCASELSEGTVARMEQQVERHLPAARCVLLDLSEAAFANSAGLRWLARLSDGLQAQRKPLRVLVRPGSPVERAFCLTGYDRRVELHRSARSAWR